ncbi:MAG TPA: DUF5312 family protein, partial [Spirochaetia bacterium]|nr:DUF5312 family protein [Spirochaetia bacterium]
MANASTFEALVLDLSPAERSEMLARLQRSCTVSAEPLFERGQLQEPRIDYRAAYRDLGLVTRIIITLRSIFGGGSK